MPILTTMFCSCEPTSTCHTEMIVRTPMVIRWNSTDSSRLTDLVTFSSSNTSWRNGSPDIDSTRPTAIVTATEITSSVMYSAVSVIGPYPSLTLRLARATAHGASRQRRVAVKYPQGARISHPVRGGDLGLRSVVLI